MVGDELLTFAQVCQRVKFCKTKVREMRRDPALQFPAPYRLLGSNRWSALELTAWIEWLKTQGRERVA